jgi:LuxR family maltose regulon positive regulatory protein
VNISTEDPKELELALLRTKLHRPPVSDDLVSRQRLLERLDSACQRPFTLVCAPAGFGKTTLLSSWLDKRECPSAWISLDEQDSDLVVFLHYLLSTIEGLHPDAMRETRALLSAYALPPLPALARSLSNELDRIQDPLVLILDDYHTIHDAAVHDLLARVLRHPPRSLHLVLISRRDPPLPLVTLRARRQMAEIRAPDLCFTTEETTTFLRQVMGIPVDDATISTLEQKTEGWVTGLRLAALSLQHSGDRDRVSAGLRENNRYVMEYLATEVVSRQPPGVQEGLLKTSILDRFCAPLYEVVCGPGECLLSDPGDPAFAELAESGPVVTGSAFIEWLRNAGLFVVPLDSESRWYRYHHLFQQLLRQRLERVYGHDEIASLHAQVSQWFAENGYIEEALQHALAAGDLDAAVQLVEERRHEVMEREQWPRLQRWLDLFPRELIERRAQLSMVEAWLLHDLSRLHEIPPILERVEALLAEQDLASDAPSDGVPSDGVLTGAGPSSGADERVALRGEVAALRSTLLYWTGQGQLCLDSARYAEQATPAGRRWVRGVAEQVQALAYHQLGRLDEAYRTLDRLLARDRQSGGALAHRWYHALWVMHWLSADLKRTARVAQQMAEVTQRRQLAESTGWAQYALGLVHYQRNDLAQASQHLAQVIELRDRAHSETLAQAHFGLALTYQAMGRADEAGRTLESAAAWALGIGNMDMLLKAETMEVRLALSQGKAPHMEPWAARAADALPVMVQFEVPALTLVKAHLARGTAGALQEAKDLLARLRQFVESTHSTLGQIEVLALQALLHDARGEQEAALQRLGEAVDLARPGGLIRLFVDLGPRMANLLTQLRERGRAADYTGQILAAYLESGPALASVDQGALIESLTDRELEILALLARRLSNKEIAAQLVISSGTVKSHTIRIYQKLDAKGRRQAVVKAMALGILPST